MTCSPGRRLITYYLGAQATLGLAWWLTLWLVPASRSLFVPTGMDASLLLALAVPDGALFVCMAAVGAALAHRGPGGVRTALLLCAGATWYAALLCLGLELAFGGYLAPTVMMAAPALCVGMLAFTCTADEPVHARLPMRVARDGARTPVWVRTLGQIVVFWGVLLVAVPALIAWCERSVGFPAMPGSVWVGAALFAMGGALGLASAVVMVRLGKGTPLPVDSPPELVVAGVYRFVRNPMAVGGIAQGVGVAIALGSWWTLAYALFGALLWDRCVRPIEEADLLARFGEPYEEYARRVRCWCPRFGAIDADG